MYYPCSENKGADQLITAKLICAFVFAYADCWVSHEAAHFLQKVFARQRFPQVGVVTESQIGRKAIHRWFIIRINPCADPEGGGGGPGFENFT